MQRLELAEALRKEDSLKDTNQNLNANLLSDSISLSFADRSV